MTVSNSISDLALLQAFKAGQKDALGTIYHRYYPQVYRMAYRILGNRFDAEDLTQEVFLTLWRCTYDPGRGGLSSYLNLITRSRAIDRLRSWSATAKFLDKWHEGIANAMAPIPLEQVIEDEDSLTVRSALRQLPDRQRQVLEMAYYGGLSQSKIASAIEIPLGTVKSWTRQGLFTMRHKLQSVS